MLRLPLPSGVARNPLMRPRERSDPQQPSRGREGKGEGEKEEGKWALGDNLADRSRNLQRWMAEKDGRDNLRQIKFCFLISVSDMNYVAVATQLARPKFLATLAYTYKKAYNSSLVYAHVSTSGGGRLCFFSSFQSSRIRDHVLICVHLPQTPLFMLEECWLQAWFSWSRMRILLKACVCLYSGFCSCSVLLDLCVFMHNENLGWILLLLSSQVLPKKRPCMFAFHKW